MAKLQQILNDEIRKQARKEIAGMVKSLRTQMAEVRKTIKEYAQRIKELEKAQNITRPVIPALQIDKNNLKPVRLTPARIRKCRMKIGLTQAQFASLLGVNTLSVNHWETGKTRPRMEQKQRISRLRDLGKRELAKILADKKIVVKKQAAKPAAAKKAAPAKKPAAAAKKAAPVKKTAPAKKPVAAKPAPAKKPVAAKPAPAKKPADVKKAAPAKKPAAVKKAPAKKAAPVKKPAVAKKPEAVKKVVPAKKPAAAKPAPVKKPASAEKPAAAK